MAEGIERMSNYSAQQMNTLLDHNAKIISTHVRNSGMLTKHNFSFKQQTIQCLTLMPEERINDCNVKI